MVPSCSQDARPPTIVKDKRTGLPVIQCRTAAAGQERAYPGQRFRGC